MKCTEMKWVSLSLSCVPSKDLVGIKDQRDLEDLVLKVEENQKMMDQSNLNLGTDHQEETSLAKTIQDKQVYSNKKHSKIRWQR